LFYFTAGFAIIIGISWIYRVYALVMLPFLYCKLRSKHKEALSLLYKHNKKRRMTLAEDEEKHWSVAKGIAKKLEIETNLTDDERKKL
jgi:hypothetical protein